MSISTDVFRTMTPDECRTFFQSMRDEIRPLYRQAEVVAAAVLRVRPVFLGQQPFPKRIEMMRKALAMKVNAEASGELLASFILEKHVSELVELLDLLKVEHEEGALKGNAPPEPDAKTIKTAVETFRKGENPHLRMVILKAFAGQPAIDWPQLDVLLFGEAPVPVAANAAKPAAASPAAQRATAPAAKLRTKSGAKSTAKSASKTVASKKSAGGAKKPAKSGRKTP